MKIRDVFFDWSDSESEIGLEERDAATLISTSESWVRVRMAQNGYKLPGTGENPKGPNNEGLNLQAETWWV